MNEIRRIESEAEEIARIRAKLDQFSFPSFVTGYSIWLGEFDDEPALWVKFETDHDFPDSDQKLMAIGERLSGLTATAYDYLREHVPERYPYFRFDPSDHRG